MRISEYVAANGIDSFSLEDFFYVGSKVSSDPSRLVLVGGQAIEAWGHYFKVVAPTGNAQPLTEDTDWYGDRKAAIWLCNLLGSETTQLTLADGFDPSPNTAVALHQRPDGRVVMMDFLRSLVGIHPNDITTRAVPVQVGPVKLHILHPLLCLESRLANLEKLPGKRNLNGKMQAEWAVKIVEAFLRELVGGGAPNKQLMKAISEVAESAEFRSGPYCFDEFQIDPLKAVSPDVIEAVGGLFVSEDWPRRVARIQAKRAQRVKRQDLLQQRVTYKFTLTSPKPAPSMLRKP
ncbi:MAG: hypothetical protein H7255_02040 [Ramlibacter sp.]|nr:hypothetical protein [Ramlibacter sp.]